MYIFSAWLILDNGLVPFPRKSKMFLHQATKKRRKNLKSKLYSLWTLFRLLFYLFKEYTFAKVN